MLFKKRTNRLKCGVFMSCNTKGLTNSFRGILGIVLMVISVACGRKTNPEARTIVRTDPGPIEKRFPGLSPFIKCFWEADVVSDQSMFSLLAKTQFRIRGFILINEEKASEIARRHELSAVTTDWSRDSRGWPLRVGRHNLPSDAKDWSPPLKVVEIPSHPNSPWMTAESLNTNFSDPLRIMGEFYFNQGLRMIYFEVDAE